MSRSVKGLFTAAENENLMHGFGFQDPRSFRTVQGDHPALELMIGKPEMLVMLKPAAPIVVAPVPTHAHGPKKNLAGLKAAVVVAQQPKSNPAVDASKATAMHWTQSFTPTA